MTKRACRIWLCLIAILFIAGELFALYVSRIIHDKKITIELVDSIALDLNSNQAAILNGDKAGYENSLAELAQRLDELKQNRYAKEHHADLIGELGQRLDFMRENDSKINQVMLIRRNIKDLRAIAIEGDLSKTARAYEDFSERIAAADIQDFKILQKYFSDNAKNIAKNARDLSFCVSVCPQSLIDEKREKYDASLKKMNQEFDDDFFHELDSSKLVEKLRNIQ